MSFLVDTDIASAFIRQVPIVRRRFSQHSGLIYLSAVTLAELQVWLLRKNTPAKHLQEFTILGQQTQVLDLNSAVAQKAGEVGSDLLDRGLTIATPDLLIAATALVHGFTVATHNTQDYTNVPGLLLTDWLTP